MKLIIASDIHGSAFAARTLVEHVDAMRPDRVVLLGDILYHGPRNDLPQGYAPKEVFALLNALPCLVTACRGNCDAEVDQMVLEFPMMADFEMFDVDGHRAVATHGHLFEPGALPLGCEGAAVLMSGHTHVKVLRRDENGLILLNPGSTSIPKDGTASFATYDDGVFALRTLDGQVISELSIS